MRLKTFGAVCVIVLSVPLFSSVNIDYNDLRNTVVNRYSGVKPKEWGMYIPGVKKHIKTSEKVIALTFDACGGSGGKKYDRALLSYLKSQNVPATLFVTSSWISYNENEFAELAKDAAFEIENHGFQHKPASVNGALAWGIKGTESVAACFDEVEKSARELERRMGKRPRFYRSGTAFYDDVAVKIINDTKQYPLNFGGVIADADPKLSLEKVQKFFWGNIRPGAILIMHFNHPGGKTLPLVQSAIPRLKQMGYTFVKLQDYADKIE